MRTVAILGPVLAVAAALGAPPRPAAAPLSAPREAASTSDIRVVVLGDDDKPVAGAEMVLLRHSFYASAEDAVRLVALTDAQGRATFTPPEGLAVPGETVLILARKAGMTVGMASWDMGRTAARAPVQSITLQKAQPLRGRVVDGQGAAVAGAEVWALPSQRAPEQAQALAILADSPVKSWVVVTTDKDGGFVISAAPIKGACPVMVRAGGFRETAQTLAADKPPHVIKLAPACAVQGRLRTADGRPAAGVYVGLFAERLDDKARPSYMVRTAGDGGFCFPGVEPGAYRLTGLGDSAALGGFVERRDVRIEDDRRRLDLDLRASPGVALSGRVLRADGRPVEGALVRYALVKPEGASPEGFTYTDKDGGYRLFPPAGAAQVMAVAPRTPEEAGSPLTTPMSRQVVVRPDEPQSGVDFTAPVTRTVRVSARRPDGAPSPAAQALAWSGPHPLAVVRGDKGLEVKARFGEESVAVLAWEQGEDFAGVAQAGLAEAQAGVIVVPLVRGVTLRGRLLDEEGRPLADARVALMCRVGSASFVASSPQQYGAAAADADGRFILRGVLPAIGQAVQASHAGHDPFAWSLQGKKLEGVVDLGEARLTARDRRIEGIVVDSQGKPVAKARVTCGRSEAVADDNGRFSLAQVSRQRGYVNASATRGQTVATGGAPVEPDERFAAPVVMSTAERERMRQDAPPIHVSRWAVGGPPEGGMSARPLVLYLVDAKRRPDHAAILKDVASAAARHADKGLLAVCVYPADADPAEAAREVQGVGMAAAIDRPAAQGDGLGLTHRLARSIGVDQPLTVHVRGGRRVWGLWSTNEWRPNQRQFETEVALAVSAADVRVTALDPDGKPAAGVLLVPLSRDAQALVRDGPKTDAEGRCVLAALRGQRPITVFAVDRGRGLAGRLDVGEGEAEARMTLAKPPAVRLRVLGRDGKPVARASLRAVLAFSAPSGNAQVPVDEPLALDGDGTCVIGWLPAEAAVELTATADGHWTEHLTVAAADRGPADRVRQVVLHPCDKTLEARALGLDGRPIAGVTVSAGGVSAVTDANGIAALKGVPDKAVPVSCQGAGVAYTSLDLGPGRRTLAIPTIQELRAFREKTQNGPPPWRTIRWIVGPSCSAEDLADVPAVLALVDDDLSAELRQRLVRAALDWQARHGPAGLRTVLLFPPKTSPEAVKAAVGDRGDVSAGVDQPVNQDEDEVGWTAAVWRAWEPAAALRVWVQENSAKAHRLGRGESFEAVCQSVEKTLAQVMQRAPKRLRIEVANADGKPAADVRVLAISDADFRWVKARPEREGVYEAMTPHPRQSVSVLAWRSRDNRAAIATVPETAFQRRSAVALALRPGVALRGRVVDEQARPVAGASARLTLILGAAEAPCPADYAEVVTGPEGRFEFRGVLASHVRRLSVSHVKRSPWSRPLEEKDLQADLDLGDIKMAGRDREVRGVVLDGEGAPVRGASVSVQSGETAVTGDDGRFRLTGLPRGEALVMARATSGNQEATGHAAVPAEASFVAVALLAADRRSTVTVQMPPLHVQTWVQGRPPDAGFAGRVVLLYSVARPRHKDHAGILQMLAGLVARHGAERLAAVCLYPAGTDPKEVQAEVGPHAGLLAGVDRPAVAGESAGVTEAFAAAYGVADHAVALFDRGGNRMASFLRRDFLAGSYQALPAQVARAIESRDARVRVTDPQGRPAAGARLRCAASAGPAAQRYATDDRGEALVTTVAGEPPYVFYAFDTRRGLAGRCQAQAGEDGVLRADIRLADQPPVEGRVIDEAGKPLSGVNVLPRMEFQAPGSATGGFWILENLVTDAEGRFRIAWASPDLRLNVGLVSPDHWQEWALAPPAAEGKPRQVGDVVLHKADQTIEVSVVDLDNRPVAGVSASTQRGRAVTDERGVAVIGAAPKRPVRVTLAKAAVSAAVMLPPGRHRVCLPTAEQLRLAREEAGPTPPWRAARWLAGGPLKPEDLRGKTAIVAVPGRAWPPAMRRALAAAIGRWMRAHGDRIAAAVCILPPDSPADAAGEWTAQAPGLAVALDQPVGVGEGAPGWTAAVWGAAYSLGFPCAFVTPAQTPRTTLWPDEDRQVMDDLDRLAQEALGKPAPAGR